MNPFNEDDPMVKVSDVEEGEVVLECWATNEMAAEKRMNIWTKRNVSFPNELRELEKLREKERGTSIVLKRYRVRVERKPQGLY